jgi:hypothetical protein
MLNRLNITYLTLILLTITTAFLSTNFKVAFSIIIVIAILKFWMVAYLFMDISKAHVFWKTLILIWGIVMGTFVIALTY